MSDTTFKTPSPALPLPSAPASRPRAAAGALAANEPLLDAMRGFAALLVAYFHCRQVTWIGMGAFHHAAGRTLNLDTLVAYLTLPVAWGSAGVPIFFVISGYCIHRNSAARLHANPEFRLVARTFWLRRFVRIYPVLFAALLITFAADSISVTLPPVNHKILSTGLHAFLVNLFSLQGVAGKTYGSNGALWTLSIEVQFYVVYPLLFALRRRFGLNTVLVGIAALNVLSALVLERHDLQFFTSYWFSWVLGAWIAEIRVRESAAGAPPRSRMLYAAALALTAAGCVVFHFGQYGAFQLWAAAFACYLLETLRRGAELRNFVARGLAKIGDFSYSLYLIHLPLFVLFASLLFRSTLQTSIWPSFGFTLGVLPVAWLLYRVVERPAQRAASRIGRNKAPAAAVVTA